jgi:hypothetical protein
MQGIYLVGERTRAPIEVSKLYLEERISMVRLVKLLLLCVIFWSCNLAAQSGAPSFCSSHAQKLYCLFDELYPGATPSPYAPLFSAAGGQVTQLPIASPASGIIYTQDVALKIPVRSGQETFGPILTERGDTIGAHKLFVAFTYQHFEFSSLDAVSLKKIPIVFEFCEGAQCTPLGTINRVDFKVNQMAFFATYGLFRQVDVSVALPIIDVHSALRSYDCTICSGNTITFKPAAAAGEATGLGDVIFRVQGRVFSHEKYKVAVGTDIRVASGDALNLLGSGTTGVKPYIAASRGGRVSPHLNLGYQWNGDSILGGTTEGTSGSLPSNLAYDAGIDARVDKRLTLAADFLGSHVYGQLRVQPTTTLGVSNIAISKGNFNTAEGSVGLKFNPFSNFLITENVLWKMEHNGLRNRPVPLIGVSYTF